MNKNTITINGMEITYSTREELADIMAVMGMSKAKGKAPKGKPAPAKAELVEFVKADGTKKLVSPKQAEAWNKWKSRDRKPLDEVKAEYEAKHEAFKPSNELVKALKAKPTMSRKEAVAYGFVGTKDELKALKVELKVYDK